MRVALALLALACTPMLGFTQAVGDGYWHTDGNLLRDAAGNVVRFSGVNWHGMDSENRIMHGLWGQSNPAYVRTIEEHLDAMKAAGFNLIRLPFSSDIFLKDGSSNDVKPLATAIDPAKNGDLLALSCLQILDRLVASAGSRGIRLILDYHRLAGGAVSEHGHWYDGAHPESQWIANWKALAARYKGNPTVVGVDLFNEVHRNYTTGEIVTWEADGVNAAHNWRWAAKRCAAEILSVNPDLLICVQGLDAYNGEGGWWGAVLLGAKDHPLTLSVPNRLVYQVHDYGPIVFDQPFHQVSAGFPGNLPAHWDRQWGFIHNDGTAPIWVGEWGGVLDDSLGGWSADLRARERQWFDALRTYIAAKGLSWTWWCWTPESRDTHGILKDDYSGVNSAKLSLIAPAMYPGFASSGGGGAPPPPTPGQSPYGGAARALPGTLQAEDFDEGGEGVGYHDSDAANSGGQYRSTGVDVEACSEGGFNVGWLAPGEWLEYSVDVGTAGTYEVAFRVASAMTGGTFHLESGGADVSGPITAPGTGGWQAWQTVSAAGVVLAAGPRELRIVFDSGSFNLDSAAFTLTAAAPGGGGGGVVVDTDDGGSGGDGGCGLTGLEALFLLLALRRRVTR